MLTSFGTCMCIPRFGVKPGQRNASADVAAWVMPARSPLLTVASASRHSSGHRVLAEVFPRCSSCVSLHTRSKDAHLSRFAPAASSANAPCSRSGIGLTSSVGCGKLAMWRERRSRITLEASRQRSAWRSALRSTPESMRDEMDPCTGRSARYWRMRCYCPHQNTRSVRDAGSKRRWINSQPMA
jgi:hypothetical protein